MPIAKKRRSESFIDDEEDEIVNKRARKSTKAKENETGVKKDSDGNEYWELAGKKRVVISEFKGQRMVSIREYYEKEGQALPGKKGISLPVSHLSALISLLPQIEATLRDKGEDVPRPDYSDLIGAEGDNGGDAGRGSGSKQAKQNFEETSDEE